VSVSEEADALVVITTRASLTDAIVHGAVRTSSAGPTNDSLDTQSLTTLGRKELSGIAIDFADQPIFDGSDDVEVEGKKAHFAESIRLEHAVLTARPVVDIDLRIRDGKVSRFISKVEGNLDASVRAVAMVTSEGDLDPAILAELRRRKHEVRRVLYQSPRRRVEPAGGVGVPHRAIVHDGERRRDRRALRERGRRGALGVRRLGDHDVGGAVPGLRREGRRRGAPVDGGCGRGWVDARESGRVRAAAGGSGEEAGRLEGAGAAGRQRPVEPDEMRAEARGLGDF